MWQCFGSEGLFAVVMEHANCRCNTLRTMLAKCPALFTSLCVGRTLQYLVISPETLHIPLITELFHTCIPLMCAVFSIEITYLLLNQSELNMKPVPDSFVVTSQNRSEIFPLIGNGHVFYLPLQSYGSLLQLSILLLFVLIFPLTFLPASFPHYSIR